MRRRKISVGLVMAAGIAAGLSGCIGTTTPTRETTATTPTPATAASAAEPTTTAPGKQKASQATQPDFQGYQDCIRRVTTQNQQESANEQRKYGALSMAAVIGLGSIPVVGGYVGAGTMAAGPLVQGLAYKSAADAQSTHARQQTATDECRQQYL